MSRKINPNVYIQKMIEEKKIVSIPERHGKFRITCRDCKNTLNSRKIWQDRKDDTAFSVCEIIRKNADRYKDFWTSLSSKTINPQSSVDVMKRQQLYDKNALRLISDYLPDIFYVCQFRYIDIFGNTQMALIMLNLPEKVIRVYRDTNVVIQTENRFYYLGLGLSQDLVLSEISQFEIPSEIPLYKGLLSFKNIYDIYDMIIGSNPIKYKVLSASPEGTLSTFEQVMSRLFRS